MGSEQFYPEERPVRDVPVDGFWIDRHPVTVAEFRRFVKATGHVTWAEHAPDAADYPGADPELLVPGSLVFAKTAGPVDLTDFTNWWVWTPRADCWSAPSAASGAASATASAMISPAAAVASSGRAAAAAVRPHPSAYPP